MKVKRTISIDSELDRKISELVDKELQRALRGKNLNSRELIKIQRKYNYSRIVEELIRKGMAVKDIGL